MKKLLLKTRSAGLVMLLLVSAFAQEKATPPSHEKQTEIEAKQSDSLNKRVELNMLGKTDSSSGESRRNENVSFNLVDNNALKEMNVRLGTTATIVREFNPASSYFGAEFGNPPKSSMTYLTELKAGFHGQLYESHINSILSARSFFQVGEVKPARENDYGFNFTAPLWKSGKLFIDGSQQKIRGSVNGNVLVPKPEERTPLAEDPAVRALVSRFLAAYPAESPNRQEIDERALNTNAPQLIDNNQAKIRLDHNLGSKDQLALIYQFTAQSVDAFQFVAGQNPDTETKSHLMHIAWTRQWNEKTVSYFAVSYDRLTSHLQPAENSVGPYVLISGLTGLGPEGNIPIDREQNQIRYAAQLQRSQGGHNFAAGFGVIHRQISGSEIDAHRGFFSFSNDFGNSAITNLRLGKPSQFIISTGDTDRRFRSWDLQSYAGDKWQVNSHLNLQFGLRWQPSKKPVEVNKLNVIPYDSELDNFAPTFGFAYRMAGNFGTLRGAYGTHFGEIFFVTYQQIRFSPPGNMKVVVTAPDSLINPLQGQTGKPTVYQLDPELATPYSHQYNLSWEPEWNKSVRLQFGYVGSRSHKLFSMWYLNRAHPRPEIEPTPTTQTINQRRANPDFADIRVIVNGSRGYFDAGRISLILRNWRGLTIDASYWFSKALDLGSSYTNTANEADSRSGRSQTEYETHRDMKGPSSFDQTHAALWRASYSFPSRAFDGWLSQIFNGWNISTVVLMKTGIPFNVVTGSDGPGFGNVDGNGSDRPILLDPAILGRTVANPDTSKQLLPRSALAFIKPDQITALSERGNLGRNVFRKGPIRNVNAALMKVWTIKKELRVTLRAESINLFNTPQFAEPGFELANPNFGAITNTLNEGRAFKFTLQVGW
jgi:hypothetical protein